MSRINILLFFFCFIFLPARAAEGNATIRDSATTYHSIAIQLGMNQVRDENLHPKVHTGSINELAYEFESKAAILRQFRFAVGYSWIKTELEDLSKTLNLKLNMGYSQCYSLVKGSNFEYYAGPEAGLAYNVAYFPNWDDSHLYWANYISLGVQNAVSVQFDNGNEWISSLSIPLFTMYSRPELYRLYKIDDIDFGGFVNNLNSNFTPAFWGNAFYLKLKTEYRFPAFGNKREAFTYSLEFLRIKSGDGNPFTQISHQIGIKLLL